MFTPSFTSLTGVTNKPSSLLVITAKLFAAGLLIQLLPIFFFAPKPLQLTASLTILLHALALVPVITAARYVAYNTRRTWLFTVFTFYLLCACFIWPNALAIQNFFLLGLAGCAVLFLPNEYMARWGWAATFSVCYILMSLKQGFVQNTELYLFQVINTASLIVASLTLLGCYQQRLTKQWVKQTTTIAHQSVALNNVLPPHPEDGRKRWAPGQMHALRCSAILFLDLSGYTRYSLDTPDDRIVAMLNGLYTGFDDEATKHLCERIKTNGDGYMAASFQSNVLNKPVSPAEHARRIAGLAMSLCQFFRSFALAHQLPVDFRAGIAIGPVTAGIVGTQRSHFDVWGKTVNRAAKLEQAAEDGTIRLCPALAVLLSDSGKVKRIGTAFYLTVVQGAVNTRPE